MALNFDLKEIETKFQRSATFYDAFSHLVLEICKSDRYSQKSSFQVQNTYLFLQLAGMAVTFDPSGIETKFKNIGTYFDAISHLALGFFKSGKNSRKSYFQGKLST
jgi:hypothetical protein